MLSTCWRMIESMSLKRGDIYWIAHPGRNPAGHEIEKTRPGVIISRTKANEFRRTVLVVPLTNGSKEAPPLVITIPSAGATSKAVCDQLAAVDKKRIGQKIGSLTDKELAFLGECLRKILNI
jgi:mRNA interferase MazF